MNQQDRDIIGALMVILGLMAIFAYPIFGYEPEPFSLILISFLVGISFIIVGGYEISKGKTFDWRRN